MRSSPANAMLRLEKRGEIMRSIQRNFCRTVIPSYFIALVLTVPAASAQIPLAPLVPGQVSGPATLPIENATKENSAKSDRQLTPFPTIDELEQGAKSLHVTIEKEASASAYAIKPTKELVTSLSDEKLHDLNLQAFVCMKLGASGVRYGYQLKSVVDLAVAAQVLTTSVQNQQEESAKAADDLLTKVVDHNNALVDKYNDLAARYNALLSNAQVTANYAAQLERINNQMYALAAQALGTAWYSRPATVPPTAPNTPYVRQPPPHCMTQTMPAAVPGLASFAYTNCF